MKLSVMGPEYDPAVYRAIYIFAHDALFYPPSGKDGTRESLEIEIGKQILDKMQLLLGSPIEEAKDMNALCLAVSNVQSSLDNTKRTIGLLGSLIECRGDTNRMEAHLKAFKTANLDEELVPLT
jgi:hypothetical protein